MKRLAVFALLFAGSIALFAQGSSGGYTGDAFQLVITAPSGSCNSGVMGQLPTATGIPYTCQGISNGIGTWTAVSGSGTFTALTGDATSTSTGGATTVVGLNGTLLSGLATGFLFNTTSTGVPSSVGFSGTGNVARVAGPTFTGTLTAATLAATTINGAAFSGTFTGAPTFSGNIAFSGTPTFSNALAFASGTTINSKSLTGAGAGITTGPTTSTNGDCVQFTGTAGQIADAGSACGSGGGSGNTITSSGLTSGSAYANVGGTWVLADAWGFPTAGTTATFTNSSAVITVANSAALCTPVQFSTTSALPTNYAVNTTYYVSSTGLSSTQIEVSATCGGSVITAGSAGTGTQTAINTNNGLLVPPPLATAIATSSTVLQLNGVYTTTGLTAGSIYCISTTTAGALTTTCPSGSSYSGSALQQFGQAVSTTQLIFPLPKQGVIN